MLIKIFSLHNPPDFVGYACKTRQLFSISNKLFVKKISGAKTCEQLAGKKRI
jgi:hypothetical protein